MASASHREDLRRWAENWREAAARDRDSALVHARGRDSVLLALDLIAIAGALHGWPIPEDRVRLREDELRRSRWLGLRRALGSP